MSAKSKTFEASMERLEKHSRQEPPFVSATD